MLGTAQAEAKLQAKLQAISAAKFLKLRALRADTTYKATLESSLTTALTCPFGNDLLKHLATHHSISLMRVDRDGRIHEPLPRRPYLSTWQMLSADEITALYADGAKICHEMHDDCGALGVVARFVDGWRAVFTNDCYPGLTQLDGERFATRREAMAALCWIDDEIVTPLECAA